MKVLSYVIELFHVHQTVMLARPAAQDVSEEKNNPMDVYVFSTHTHTHTKGPPMILLPGLNPLPSPRIWIRWISRPVHGVAERERERETWPPRHNKQGFLAFAAATRRPAEV